MRTLIRFLMQSLLVLVIAAGILMAVDAVAQTCTTYYDQNTGRFCRVCPGPGGVGTVICY
jgi:hypothetical protein